MPQELAADFLIISRHEVAPAPETVARALASAGLGVAEYQPQGQAESTKAGTGGRRRLGTYTCAVPGVQATARILLWQYDGAVTEGMGEAAFTALTGGLAAEDARTLREGTLALNLRLSGPEQPALTALAWAMRAVRVLIDLTQGACIDPAAQRSYGLAELTRFTFDDPVAHLALHNEPWDAESRWLHTHGLQKFSRSELDLIAVPLTLETEARAFLFEVARTLAAGARLASGDEIDLEDVGAVLAVAAPVDADHQAPFGRLRLTDAALPGERQPVSAVRLLKRTALLDAARRAQHGDTPAALEAVDRILAADPDDCAGLALKARVYLALGHVTDALDLGELMELRVPEDYRGPLTRGVALAALGRYPEALHALNRASDRDPEAAEVFAARADVHERLGHEQLAAMDRAHVAYLSE